MMAIAVIAAFVVSLVLPLLSACCSAPRDLFNRPALLMTPCCQLADGMDIFSLMARSTLFVLAAALMSHSSAARA